MRRNLRRTILDVLAPALTMISVWHLFHAIEYLRFLAPVTANLLLVYMCLECALALFAIYNVGHSFD